MASPVIDIDKLLEIDPSNGKPVVRGTRLRVITLAARHMEGRSPKELAESFPGLTIPAVYAALAYFYEHEEQMLEDEAAEEEAFFGAKTTSRSENR